MSKEKAEISPSQAQIRSSLNSLVADIDDIERIEDELDTFNIFEALRIRYHEIRHSDFLSWLLNPLSGHQLGDLLLRRILQRAVLKATNPLQITPVDFDDWDLGDAEVGREIFDSSDKRRLDIQIVSEKNNFAALIENKVRSSERSDQLKVYRDRFHRKFANAGYKVLHILLTIDGVDASDAEYVALSYREIVDLLDGVLDRKGKELPDDCVVAIRHYSQLLRRHFVPDSKLAELAQRVYRRHKVALDYIFEQKPDLRSDLRRLIESHLKTKQSILLDDSNKTYIRFADARWEKFPELKQGTGWTSSKRMLLFEILNQEGKTRMVLVVGPGDAGVRERLLDAFSKSDDFKSKKKERTRSYTRLWSTNLLERYDTEDDPEVIFQKLRPRIDAEVEKKMSSVLAILQKRFGDKRKSGRI